ncbi:hypothetical protein [Streptomyces sp. NPDC060366]
MSRLARQPSARPRRSNTRSRCDKLTQEQLGALREFGVNWA